MIQIENTIVSSEIFEQRFLCDLASCKGECCVEGDSGAPLELDEIKRIEEALPSVWDDLSDKAKELIKQQGVAYKDADGDMVTSIIDGRECVFTYFENGVCKCALEKAYREGKTSFYKPISCHLYPIRLTEYPQFTAINYHRWKICECAEKLGAKENLPVYKFLKLPLIRKFGSEWYEQLEAAASAYEASFKSMNK